MKISIACAEGSKKHILEVVSALKKAGHKVLLNNTTSGDKLEDEQAADVYITLRAGAMSTEQRREAAVTKYHNVDKRVQKLVLVLGKSKLPRRQIIAELGLRQNSRAIYIKNYLNPAEAEGYVTKAFPGKPSLPEQTYRLTTKGLELYKMLTSQNS